MLKVISFIYIILTGLGILGNLANGFQGNHNYEMKTPASYISLAVAGSIELALFLYWFNLMGWL
jgi:hypothetical protein